MRDWLFGLDVSDRKIVGKDIATVEFGWPLGMPLCRPLTGGVHEVRSTIRAGKVEARVYFVIEGGVKILLHAAIGKDRQKQDVERAVARASGLRKGET